MSTVPFTVINIIRVATIFMSVSLIKLLAVLI